ncbi:MAG: DPP IV N-terminal domain-containing protein, partial [Bacteroidales bacterium]
IRIIDNNQWVEVDVTSKKAEVKNSRNKEAENIDLSPEKNMAAYTIENNLFISVAGVEKAITSEKDNGVVCGQTVHRNEFGISKGIFWSPKGNKMAFYRMDETMVTDYPLVNINTRIAEVENSKYPMAGMTSHQVTLGVYDVASGKTIFVKTGELKEQYLTNISWSPDEKYVFIGVLNRDQNHLQWNKYDAVTGEFIKTMFEEKSDRYVEPLNPLVFLPGSNDQFIWQSQRDGYNHLYLYNTEGQILKQLTKGPWMVTQLGEFDSKKEKIWFMATKESPLENHAYIVNLKDGKITKVTSEAGTHSVWLTSDFSLICDYYSATDMGASQKIKTIAGKEIKSLLKNENPLKDYAVPTPDFLTLKADDGTLLYGRLLKPVNFDPTKKYPVIVYVYGGPHAQLVTNSWTGGAGMFLYYLASKGYVVFTLDNRGSANRGLNFESAIFRNCGTVEVADQMVGVEWLKSQPWVDQTRMGVHGWSYGGFMTISMMLKQPGVFKAAVAGGPVIDWKYYEVMYGERYMDTPASNPDGYKNAALTNYVDKLDGRLLIIQGCQDATVVPQHCLSFLEASIKAGKLVDFFMYPNHEHNVRGKDRLHLYKMIDQYFEDHL